MKRLINVRPPLFCAVGLIVGILCAYETYFGNYGYTVAAFVLSAAVAAAVCFKKRGFSVMAAVVIAFIALGYGVMYATITAQNKNEIISQETVLSGRICDIGRNGNVNNVLYLEDCSADGVTLKGRVKCAVIDGAEYSSGDTLTLRCTLNTLYPVQNKVKTSYIRNNVRYEADVITFIRHDNGNLKTDEKIRLYVYETVSAGMDNNAPVMYAMLTGDRNAMDETTADDFRSAGVAHLLAVSGLHVGFIVAVFGFVLKRFRLPALAELAVLIVPLAFYAYICRFAPSILRAIIMTVCAYLTKAVRGSYDLPSSLSVAVIAILAFSPAYLFDAGFQLSVLSVLGIATIYARVRRITAKRRMPKVVSSLCNAAALTFSCSVSTFFATAVSYGQIPTLSVPINLFAVPLASAAFVFGLFGLIPSFFRYLLIASDKLLLVIAAAAKWTASLQFSTARVYAITFAIAVFAVMLFVFGEYANFSKTAKGIAYVTCAAVIITATALSALPKTRGNQVFAVYGYNDTALVATSEDNDMAIIGSFGDDYVISSALEYAKASKVKTCTLYFTDFAECNHENVVSLTEALPVVKAYVLDRSGNDAARKILEEYGVPVIYQSANSSTGEGVAVQSVYDGPFCGAIVACGKMKIAVLRGEDAQLSSFAETRGDIDFAILKRANKAFSDKNIPTTSLYQSTFADNYGANKYGNFTIRQKDDTINLSFR